MQPSLTHLLSRSHSEEYTPRIRPRLRNLAPPHWALLSSSWPRPLSLSSQDPLSDSDSDSLFPRCCLTPHLPGYAPKIWPDTAFGRCSSQLTTPPLAATSHPSLAAPTSPARSATPRKYGSSPSRDGSSPSTPRPPLVATLRPSPQSSGPAHLRLRSSLQPLPSPLLPRPRP